MEPGRDDALDEMVGDRLGGGGRYDLIEGDDTAER